MDPSELVEQNHDVHTHSRHYSDGWHTFEEVVRYGLRWLKADRWVGISDHSPLLENVLAGCLPDADPSARHALAEEIRRSSLAGRPALQEAIAAEVSRYVSEVRALRPRIRERHSAAVLVGLEVDWYLGGPSVAGAQLEALDYVLMAYHGRHLSGPRQAQRFLETMIRHPYTDVLAHPDTFLGNLDVRSCDWPGIFQQMERFGVLCEYNLTTPLPQDVFEIARDRSSVRFVIGSDVHDFRKLSTRRILDAWGESQGGGFDLARAYLGSFVERRHRGRAGHLMALFDTEERLAALEARTYARTRRVDARATPLSDDEKALIACLDAHQEDELDRQFLKARLGRFSALPPERIASTMPAERFLTALQSGRRRRRSHGQGEVP